MLNVCLLFREPIVHKCIGKVFEAQCKEHIITLIKQYPSEMLVFANYLHEFQHVSPQHVTTALLPC